MDTLQLKYGCNPHQATAKLYRENGLPFEVLNGKPGYINFMDALNAYQLVREVKASINKCCAASFKHVSPAGAAIGRELTKEEKKMFMLDEDMELSDLASAYVRARGADRMSSFGDFAAFSDVLDESCALVLKKEVSDGVIAPGYTKEALEILKNKKGGNYTVIQIDADYEPEKEERKNVFGVDFVQDRNDFIPTNKNLEDIVTKNKNLPDDVKEDMILLMVTLKYTQSNSVALAYKGQIIGCGAGQQSRIHCTRLASEKADTWFLRHHPSVLKLDFKEGLKRPEKDNAIDMYLRDDLSDEEQVYFEGMFSTLPVRLTKEEKAEFIASYSDVVLGSDAFFPFRDNIDRAYQSRVKYVVEPGHSIRDDIVIEACDTYDMVMCFTNVRLFHH